MPSSVSIRIGEQGEDFAKRYPDDIHVNRQPAGLNFYSINWTPRAKGRVTFAYGTYSFSIENVLAVSGFQNTDFPEEGMPALNVIAGISGAHGISHEDARKKMLTTLQQILQAGWQGTIPRSRPRLRGQDMLNYLFTERSTTLDPGYTPAFEEWMRIESRTRWEFYADRIFLNVSFTRERTLTDPNHPAAYLISFEFKSEALNFRSYVDPRERKRWKELLPAELEKLTLMRAEEEARMRARGIKIDESYQDPPLPDLS